MFEHGDIIQERTPYMVTDGKPFIFDKKMIYFLLPESHLIVDRFLLQVTDFILVSKKSEKEYYTEEDIIAAAQYGFEYALRSQDGLNGELPKGNILQWLWAYNQQK